MARITSAKRMSDEAEKRKHRGIPKTSVPSCCSVRGRAIRNNAIRVQCVFKYAGDLRKQRAEHNCTGDAPALDSGACARSSARYADCCDACTRGAGASIAETSRRFQALDLDVFRAYAMRNGYTLHCLLKTPQNYGISAAPSELYRWPGLSDTDRAEAAAAYETFRSVLASINRDQLSEKNSLLTM